MFNALIECLKHVFKHVRDPKKVGHRDKKVVSFAEFAAENL